MLDDHMLRYNKTILLEQTSVTNRQKNSKKIDRTKSRTLVYRETRFSGASAAACCEIRAVLESTLRPKNGQLPPVSPRALALASTILLEEGKSFAKANHALPTPALEKASPHHGC